MLKGTALSLLGILLVGGVFVAAPSHAQAAITVWNQALNNNDYSLPGLKKPYPFPAYTITSGGPMTLECMTTFTNCTETTVTHSGMAGNFNVRLALDKAGAASHASNADSLTWYDYPNSGIANNLPTFYWNVHGGSSANQVSNKTGGKLCKIIDSTSTATWTTGSYNSPQDNKLLRYGQIAPGNVWQIANADDIGNSYIKKLTCTTTALPANTLSASPTTITSGQSSTITFDAGANSEAQSTVCTPVNFTVPSHTRYGFAPRNTSCTGGFFGSPYVCEYEYQGVPTGVYNMTTGVMDYVQDPDTSGSVVVSPTVTTTYQYNCTNGNGTTNRSVTVTVGAITPPATITGFSASPASIAPGGSSLLSWSSANATSCTSGNFTTGGATSAVIPVSPAVTTTYSLSCTGPGGTSAMSYATVTVTGTKDLSAGSVTPTTAVAGTATTFSSTISNNGTASTGAGFTNTFEVDSDADHSAVMISLTDTSPTLAAGATDSSTISRSLTAGVWYVRVCADSTSAIAESNEGNNCSAWTTVTVSAPTSPDITAGAVTPITATAGAAVTLSSTISNVGTAATGAGFTNLFQRATDASGSGSTDIGTHSSSALASGGSGAATVSYTFPSAATWYVRVCADKNSAAGTGTITEGNEGNNCGAWTAVTVTGPAGINLTPSATTPTTAVAGTPVTLSSTVTNSGSASTGTTFTNVFHTAVTSAGAGLVVAGTATNPVRPGGTSGATTLSYTFPSAGTFYTRVCVDNNASYVGTITETNEGDNCSAWTAITVSSPPAGPDLTAGAVTPIDVYVNVALTLSSTVTNSGTVSTGSTFTDVFQVANDASGTGATVLGTFANPIRAAGTSGVATRTHTFNSTGLKYVRVCADNNASMAGTIAETNEGNNCGPWTEISVTSAQTGNWVGQGCGDITQSYNASCNLWAEPLDITCPEGQRLDVQDTTCPVGSNNGLYKRAARCVVDSACSAPPPSAACVINTTVGVNVPATSMVQRGSNQDVQVDIFWGDASPMITSGAFPSGSCYPAWNPGCNGSYDTNTGGGQYGNQHIYTVPGTYEMVADVRNGFIGGEVISLNGTWSGDGSSSVSCTVNVAGPNLIMGGITPTTASAGVATTLSATATNNGSVQTGSAFSTFTDVYQTATSAAGAGATVIGTATHNRLAAGASSASNFSYSFPTAGTVYVRACTDNNASFVGTVAESNELDNCGAWTAVTVTGPNLIATSFTPAGAVAGTASTFSATITNNGSLSTGATFTDLFQLATDASGTGATDIGTFANPIRAANTSNAATLSYTFTTPGAKYMRVCADKASAAGTGTITEGNESDNCTPWTLVKVTSPTTGPNLTADAPTPVTAVAGVATTITSNVRNMGNVTTGVGFTNLFQFDADSDHSSITSTQTDTSPTVASGLYDASSVSRTFATAGTWYVRVCADNNASFVGAVIETSENDNCSAWTSVNVSNPGPGSNLQAGDVTPIAAIAGTALTLSAQVQNVGSVTTGTGFNNLFQFDADTDHRTISSTQIDTSPTLGAGTTDTSSVSTTFASAGTWYVRVCADSNASFVGTIVESNEGDNCGNWTAVSVGVPGGANLTAGSVTPTTVAQGTPVTITATVTNNGTASTVYGFTNLFQFDADTDHSAVTSTQTDTAPALAGSSATYVSSVAQTFPSSGIWYVRACADNNASFVGAIVESNEGDNCGAWTQVTVGTTAGINLTAGSITPGVATKGTAVSLVSVITNAGNTSTGTTFTDHFQMANDSSGTGATSIGTYTNPIRAAGTSGNATRSYTFASAGTFYVRACADQNAAFVGTITETNEGDNCGAWTPIVVSTASASLSCTVSPGAIASGGSATWSASPSNLGTYTWTPSEGGAAGGTGATLARTYTGSNLTFGMTVTAGGNTANCPNLSVGASPDGPAVPVITTSPPRVVPGDTVVITVSATSVDGSCRVLGPGLSWDLTPNASGVITSVSTTTQPINNQSTYTMTCDGETPIKTIVNLIPAVQEF